MFLAKTAVSERPVPSSQPQSGSATLLKTGLVTIMIDSLHA